MAQLLVVEDDAAVAEALQLALTRLGHVVQTAGTAEAGLALVDDGQDRLDLAIVDVMLPGMDGFELCRRLAAADAMPVVLLPRAATRSTSSSASSAARTTTSPSRWNRVCWMPGSRRYSGGPPAAGHSRDAPAGGRPRRRRGGDGRHPGRHQLHLTPTELRLLLELLHHPGQVLSRRTLLERVWDYGYLGDSRLVDACVQRLRAKIEDEPANPALIRTVRGVGYRFVLP